MSNHVVKKIVYYIEAVLQSPLCVSNGEGALTDQDVIKDAEGCPFIPGSSLAGAMRGYLGKASDESCILGYEKMGGAGQMSSVYVSDFQFLGKTSLKIRDGIALTSRKTSVTGAKYDMEVVDTGAKGYFYLELVIRNQDDEFSLQNQFCEILSGWKKEDIRFGAKKTRGYGQLRLSSVKRKVFDQTNILEYADVYCYDLRTKIFDASTEVKLEPQETEKGKYITVRQPLELVGGISIRQYAAEKGKPDFSHVTANGAPVIPGTSFAGALRHRMEVLLHQLGEKNGKEILEGIFGYVDAGRQSAKAHQSQVIINECVLEGSTPLTMIRNGISRFESGAKQGALFKETTYVGGKTTLEIRIEKNENERAMLGIILLALKDLIYGYLAVGGQTAVGRGIFQADGRLEVSGIQFSEEACLKNVYELLQKKGGSHA